MPPVNTATGFFASQRVLEQVLSRLEARALPVRQLSLAARGACDTGPLAAARRRALELDSPRCGPFWVSGALADVIQAAALCFGDCGCESRLEHGLRRAGVPAHLARDCEDALAHGDTLLFVHGSPDEIERTLDVLCDAARRVRLHTAFRWDA